ncbi:MAG: SpvB/TcaC N-terminal domain-containing protein [Bacteroidota bacterium]
MKNYIKVKLNPQTVNHYVGGNSQIAFNPSDIVNNNSTSNIDSKIDSKKGLGTKIKFENNTTNIVYASDLNEGSIGVTKKGDFDFIYDNIFKVNINENDLSGKEIYLSYDIKGIDKSTLPSRSVNFNKVVGGYVVKFSNEWQNVEEKISASWLKNGLNTIFFTLPNQALYNYKIKNLRIAIRENVNSNHLIELKNLIGYKNEDKNIYLNGFVNVSNQIENSGYTLRANGKPIKITDNQFEDKLINIDNKNVELKLFKNNILIDKIDVKATEFIKADRNYDLETLDSKLNSNNSVVKNYAEYETKKYAIEELRHIDIPQFESSFINVTKNKTAYRVNNLKVKDSTAFKLFIEYDSLLIPNGYTEKDIQTFHFDRDYKKWIAVEKDSLIEDISVVVALSSKDGDYVNGIVQAPESPQTSSFTPTMMNDIKAADPTSGMTLMSPPEVSQKGDANLGYPIKIPSGRNGMQPSVSVNYNSDGGNGWLGLGWGINTPAITIDTKWGVPTFDPIEESEIYNLNGEQLMYPKVKLSKYVSVDWMPNRHIEVDGIYQTNPQQRGTIEKQFTPRKQGSFAKIERKGLTPSNYYWKVTSTDGTVSWYGGKDGVVENSVIRDSQNNIVHWALHMVEDVNSNNIKYEYNNSIYNTTDSYYENLNEGKVFYVKEIFYTGFNGSIGNYSVEFVSDNAAIRNNPIINAKNGVKQIDIYLLKQINVKNNNELIRNYKFNYITGKFNKTLLESVAEFDKNDIEFYKHKFNYYDDVGTDALFETPKFVNIPSLESPTPSFTLGYGLLGASRINTTQTLEAGWEIRPAIGFEINWRKVSNNPAKTVMFGLPFGASYPRSRGIISMADLDGNGLDDIIYKHADGISYRPCYVDINTNVVSYGNVINISGIDAFYRGEGKTQNKFFQSWDLKVGLPWGKNNFHIGSRRFISKNYTDVYFTDGNGDGLIDIVKNNNVVFNQGLNVDGSNNFSSSSANTPNMLITAESDTIPGIPVRDEITDESGFEAVRVWVAPKAGTIKITDMLSIESINGSVAKYSIETSKSSINNGIPFRLYFKKLTANAPDNIHNLEITTYNGNNPQLGSNNNSVLSVERGQRIYFRLNYKDQNDTSVVNSNPIVEYINEQNPATFLKDENQINHLVNNHNTAFLLNDNQLYSIPSSGNVKIEWDPIILNTLSDEVTYRIIKVTSESEELPNPGDNTPENNSSNNMTPDIEEVIFKQTVTASNDTSNPQEIRPESNQASSLNVSNPFSVNVCRAEEGKPSCAVDFKFEVYSDSNQKWTDLQWKPKLTFTPDEITDTNNITVRYPIADHSVYKSTFVKKMAPVVGWNTPNSAVVYGIKPRTSINIGVNENAIFNMVVKKNGQFVGKTMITIVDGDVYSDNSPILFEGPLNINDTNSQFEYTVGFYTDDKEDSEVINKYLFATNNMPALVGYDLEYPNTLPETDASYLPIQVDNCYNSLQKFGTMYKEWGQFFYNDDLDSSTTIPSDDYGKLLNKDIIDKNYSINQDTFGTFSECDQPSDENNIDAYVECTSNSAVNNLNLNDINPDQIPDDPSNPIYQEINPAFLLAIPTRNYVNTIEDEKWKGLFDTQFTSSTKFKSGNFSGSYYDTIFPNEEATGDVLIQANLQTGMPAITKLVESSSVSKNLGWSNPNFFNNATLSRSHSRYSEEVNNFMDINGDSYPDIISANNVKFTNKRGGFYNSIAHGYGVINSSKNVGVRFSSNSDGIAMGRKMLGKKAFNTDRGKAAATASIPIDVNFYNNNRENLFWVDLNGDGLLDRVKEDDNQQVKCHISNGKSSNMNFTNYAFTKTNETKPGLVSTGLNVGLSLIFNSVNPDNLPLQVDFNLGYANQSNTTKTTFQDIDGDGLTDLLNVSNGEGTFNINNGNAFSSEQINLQYVKENVITLDQDNRTSSLTVSGSASKFWALASWFKWPKWLKIFHVKVGGTVSGSASLSLSHGNKTFKDFNGDGFVDYVERDGNNLKVYYSRIKRTNKLQTVTNPLGGTFTIDYKAQPVSVNNPRAKWAMSFVSVHDGRNLVNDGDDTFSKSFKYENAKYDRRERAFYGYETVEVHEKLDADTSRKSVTKYHNSSYFLEGLVKETAVYKTVNDVSELYSKTENTYEIKATTSTGLLEINTTQPLTFDVGGKEGRRQAGVLLTKTVNSVYEFGTTPLTSEIVFKYDAYGRVSEYTNKGNIAYNTDDYKSVITYHTGLNNNLISIPKQIQVFDGATLSNLVRQREVTSVNSNTGSVLSVKALLNSSNEFAQTNMTYDTYGNLKTVVYPTASAGQMSYTYKYDTVLNKYLIEVEDAMGYKSSSVYDYNFDTILKNRDITANEINYQYDDLGRLTKIIAPKENTNNQADYTISFAYMPTYAQLQANTNYASFVSQDYFTPFAVTKHYDKQHPTDPIETVNFVDGLGKNIQVKKDIEVNTGTPQSPNYSQQMTISGYTTNDVWGRTIKTYQPRGENKDTAINFILNQAVVPNAPSSSIEYDVLDRTTKTIDFEGNVSNMSYAIANDPYGILAFKTKSIVQQNATTQLINESFTDVKGQNISTLNAGSIKTRFVYDAIGQLKSYTDDENIITKYKYDLAGRKLEVNHPDNGVTKYIYDVASNLTKIQTSNLGIQSQFIEYTYDILKRPTQIKYPSLGGVDNVANVTYSYGLPNCGYNKEGRLITQIDATGSQEFEYGIMGETTAINRIIQAPNLPTRIFTTEFEYDSFNRIQKLIYPDGEKVSYSYNKGGNLNKMTTQINGAAYDYIKQIDYDYFEQKTYMKYGNNTETFYNYTPDQRRLNTLKVKASSGQNMFNNTYSYDKVGNITKVINDATHNTTNYMGGIYDNDYSYDNLNRLTVAKGSFTGFISRGTGHNKKAYELSMKYNTTHGITQKKQLHTSHGYMPMYENTYTNDYEYEQGTHKVTAITNTENSTSEYFEYDANGNMLQSSNSDGFRKMYWDESNRLRVVNDNNEQLQHYIYDAAGERILKASSQMESVYENGQIDATSTTMGLYTTYVNSYVVVDANQKYSKHYFNGSQRVASKIGDQDISIFEIESEPLKQQMGAENKVPENAKATDFNALKNLQITDFNYYLGKTTENGKKVKVKYTEYKKEEKQAESTSVKASESNAQMATLPEVYYYHSDHLGTGTFLSDGNGNPYQFFLNLPFGETMMEQHSYTGDYTNKYKFSGKELDEETGFYYFGARYYNPKFSIWLSVDPLAEKFPNWNPYNYCMQNPINLIDPDGRAPGDPVGPGYYAACNTSRTVGFGLRHPIIAFSIGYVRHNSTNISTNSARFAINTGLPENASNEGSHINAFRHALWQAEITGNYGSDVAKQVGNAHEENPYAATGSNLKTTFATMAEADQTIDLLNNQIGRKIGEENKGKSMEDKSLAVLDHFGNNGLWTAFPNTDKDGKIISYSISRTVLTDEQYLTAKSVLSTTNSNGYTPEQKASRDAEIARKAEGYRPVEMGEKF